MTEQNVSKLPCGTRLKKTETKSPNSWAVWLPSWWIILKNTGPKTYHKKIKDNQRRYQDCSGSTSVSSSGEFDVGYKRGQEQWTCTSYQFHVWNEREISAFIFHGGDEFLKAILIKNGGFYKFWGNWLCILKKYYGSTSRTTALSFWDVFSSHHHFHQK